MRILIVVSIIMVLLLIGFGSSTSLAQYGTDWDDNRYEYANGNGSPIIGYIILTIIGLYIAYRLLIKFLPILIENKEKIISGVRGGILGLIAAIGVYLVLAILIYIRMYLIGER